MTERQTAYLCFGLLILTVLAGLYWLITLHIEPLVVSIGLMSGHITLFLGMSMYRVDAPIAPDEPEPTDLESS